MSLNRIAGGRTAKSNGDGWEDTVKLLMQMRGWAVVRIPNGCQVYKAPGGTLKTRLIKSPFDFIATKNKTCVFFDAKTYNRARIQRSDIEQHQVDALLLMASEGNTAGYMVYFRPIDTIAFYAASQLMMIPAGEGLSADQGIILGGLQSMNIDSIFQTDSKSVKLRD
jgi:Holliday junction resolvase